MPKVIQGTLARGAAIAEDTWISVASPDEFAAAPRGADLILPLAFWRTHAAEGLGGTGRIGVRLGPADDPAELAPALQTLGLIAVEFPVFSDGRGFSIARLLRERHGYQGELRAVGDVLRDQIYYLLRCGFDSFAVRPDKDIDAALEAFGDFSEAYQSGVDRPLPLYRRRLAGRIGKDRAA